MISNQLWSDQMREEERRDRKPWLPTEPQWISSEERKRWKQPELHKQAQAHELRTRFAKYSGMHIDEKKPQPTQKNQPGKLAKTLIVAVIAYAVWRYLRQ
jgi:hypothetical protein